MVIRSRMSIAEFERVAHRLGACELVRGEVVYSSPGGLPHSSVSGTIAGLLSAWARKTRRGRILANEAGLITEEKPGTVRGADVAFISYERLPRGPLSEGFSRVAPELVVEIVGKSQGWAVMVEKLASISKWAWIVCGSSTSANVRCTCFAATARRRFSMPGRA